MVVRGGVRDRVRAGVRFRFGGRVRVRVSRKGRGFVVPPVPVLPFSLARFRFSFRSGGAWSGGVTQFLEFLGRLLLQGRLEVMQVLLRLLHYPVMVFSFLWSGRERWFFEVILDWIKVTVEGVGNRAVVFDQ